jgi:coenzyme F420-reducing hydrogenase delta subunit
MRPRSDGLPYSTEAVVDEGLCLRCGICTGACPTATPFRRRSDLVPGIELPSLPVRVLRERTLEAAAGLSGEARVLVYSCRHGADVSGLEAAGVAAITLPCVAQLPPSFLDFVISGRHADGVLLAGCRDGDCHYRLGVEWTQQRLAGERDPVLRARVPRARIEACWLGQARTAELPLQIAGFRARLAALEPWSREPAATPEAERA